MWVLEMIGPPTRLIEPARMAPIRVMGPPGATKSSDQNKSGGRALHTNSKLQNPVALEPAVGESPVEPREQRAGRHNEQERGGAEDGVCEDHRFRGRLAGRGVWAALTGGGGLCERCRRRGENSRVVGLG